MNNTIILFAVIGAIIGIIIGRQYIKEAYNPFPAILPRLIAGIVIGAIIGFFASLIISKSVIDDKISYETNKTEIYSMTDNNAVNGVFFLGIGTIKDIQYYHYYELLDNGGKKSGKIPVDGVTIFEDTDSIGYLLEIRKKIPKDHWSFNWTINSPLRSETEYEFHIPKGSVTNNFKLDLK